MECWIFFPKFDEEPGWPVFPAYTLRWWMDYFIHIYRKCRRSPDQSNGCCRTNEGRGQRILAGGMVDRYQWIRFHSASRWLPWHLWCILLHWLPRVLVEFLRSQFRLCLESISALRYRRCRQVQLRKELRVFCPLREGWIKTTTPSKLWAYCSGSYNRIFRYIVERGIPHPARVR